MRTSEKRRVANKAVKSEIGTWRRKLASALSAGDSAECRKVFSRYCSVLDKAVKKGVIKRNASDRRKARASKKIAAI